MRWLVVIAIAAASNALADDPRREAREHFDRASALHKEKKFTEALDEMKTAFALDPSRTEILYAIAQLHVQLGECDLAVSFYERFLQSKPAAAAAAKAQQAIEMCKKTNPPPVATPTPVEPKPIPVTPAPPTPVPVESVAVTSSSSEQITRPWYTDMIGNALVGAGMIGGVVAAIQYKRALSDNDAAEAAATYPERLELVESARDKRTTAIVIGAVGGGLIVAGVVHYFVGSRTETRVIVSPTEGGGTVTWWHGF